MTPQEQRLNEKVTKILFYLESDSSTNQKGLVEKVSDIEQTINKMEMQTFKVGAVFGVIGGGVGWLLKIMITKIIA